MKLFAYGTLANFWINLATRDPVSEEEAKALLQLQDALIKEFEKTLTWYLDFPSMKAFMGYVTTHKVWAK